MYKIKTLNKISPVGTDLFDKSRYTVSGECESPDAIMVRSASMHDMELDPSVKAVVRAGAGTNNIPSDKYASQGVVVFNTPGANANAVKELTILGLLISSRKIPEAIEWVNTLKGKGDQVPELVEKGKGAFVGPEIYGKKLGVIGLGAIGVLVANAAKNLGMTVYGYDPFISVNAAWGLSASVVHAGTLKEIYENCDYISLNLPYNAETKGMINADTIAMMKHGARLLNFARRELAVSADIAAALDSGKLSAYVLDFPNDDLIGQKGVINIPHLGASTPESEDNCAKMGALQLIDYLENGNITNSVNFPNASLPFSGNSRLCIFHKNVAAMISQFTTIMGDAGTNIEDMVNRSKGDNSYTIIDFSSGSAEKFVDKIAAISGVIKVRLITNG
ncbi:MAG: phosphoglycerate dehydrogenase [Oscillospiraceae bacterium]|nr:phosphoglycerate dehydrogenase [Oscillospiraceae bacterium]